MGRARRLAFAPQIGMPPAVQSVRFPRALWSQKAARAWLRAHGFVPIKPVDVTAGQLRYRMRKPEELRDYIVKRLGGAGEIQLVIGLTEVRRR
jgi:hypothetical protein